jgi:acyl-CoA synthetase (AMP-forming)/AMP-acid ligase II
VDGSRRWTYAEFLAVYYPCARLGLVCVPVNLGWRPDEVAYVLSHPRSRGLVVESQLLPALRRLVVLAPHPQDSRREGC